MANVLAMTSSNSDAYGKIFNIGAGGRVTIRELYNAIRSTMGVDIEPVYGDVRKGDIPHSNASIDKAKKILGYKPNVDFNEGVCKTVGWFV